MWIMRKYRYWEFNRKHQTSILSLDASINATYGKRVVIYRNAVVSSDVSIGQYSVISAYTRVENCSMGNYCTISAHVNICPQEHDVHYTLSAHPLIEPKGMKKRQAVEIGHGVLITLNAIILSGVHIGNGAVIGAGAVVTKDVCPYEIVGGVPAKHIGWRFDQETIDKIEQSSWWLKEPDEIRDIQQMLFPDVVSGD